MKVMFLVFCTVVGVVGALKCHQGATAKLAAESAECTDGSPTKCSGPKFAEYTGYFKADQPYACGACAGDAGDNCLDCTTDGCNAPLDGVHKFTCTQFKYNTADKGFKAEADVTTCNALKDTKAVCNSNGAKADKDYVVEKAGCGPCLDAQKTAEKCVKCDGENCNSAATITAFLLPMIALFYTLF